MADDTEFAYDRILYPNFMHPQTHPERLATVARFFGMSPKPVENCRVLELGCGAGAGLLTFALSLPGSEFVGVDLGEKPIESGNRTKDAVGLSNVTLIQGDVMEISKKEFGEFDYIIAHGLYSWVPQMVRQKVLAICRELMAEQGVAFISYNTLPGWLFRQMARDMMLYHTRTIEDPNEKIHQAIAMLKFITEGAPSEKYHKQMLETELEITLGRMPESTFHDDLSEINQAFYLHQFVEDATKHDLRYVSDVEYSSAGDLNYPESVTSVLMGLGDDLVRLEQYLDFLTCRRFRQSLLCHKEVELSRSPNREIVKEMYIGANVRPETAKPTSASPKVEKFFGPKTEKVEVDHPLTKAAIRHLGEIWPQTLSFSELVKTAVELLNQDAAQSFELGENDELILCEIFFRLYSTGMMQMHIHRPKYATVVSSEPTSSPLARWQIAQGDSVSNLRCEGIVIEDLLGRKLITLLDGTRDRQMLLDELTQYISSDDVEAPADVKEKIINDLPNALEENLKSLAERALLVA